MEISSKHINDPARLVQDLNTEALDDTLLPGFRDAVLSHFPVADWQGRPVKDLANALSSFHDFIQKRQQDEVLVEVFNPSLDEHGWVCGRSVVLFCVSDQPFLVDSVRMVLEEGEYAIHISKSTILDVNRKKGELTSVRAQSPESKALETFAYFEITAISDAAEREALVQRVREAIEHVHQVVSDYHGMLERLAQAERELGSHSLNEESAFLEWLKASHFTFLGYRELDFDTALDTSGDLEGRTLKENVAERMGIFKVVECESLCLSAASFAEGARAFYGCGDVIGFSKSKTRSTVHRNVYPDYIVIKKLNAEGRVVGERRFLGFYTYSVSAASPFDIPILRSKVQHVLDRSGLSPRSHDGKRLLRYIDLHPKSELFQSGSDELFECFRTIVELNERDIVKLIARPDAFGQFFSFLVYVPRELYTTDLRLKIQSLLGAAIGAHDADVSTFFSESKHARAHIVFTLNTEPAKEVDVAALEAEVIELTYGWKEHFRRALEEQYGEKRAGELYKNFCDGIAQSFQEQFDARTAARDVAVLESLHSEDDITMQLYRPANSQPDELKFRVSHLGSMLELSDVIPILENLGLRVLGEQPFYLRHRDGRGFWVHDFHLRARSGEVLGLNKLKANFEQAFERAWVRDIDSDAFNQLVLAAELSWREVNLLRAYANYMKQTLFPLSLDYCADTLVTYPATTRKLVDIFNTLFSPDAQDTADERLHKAELIAKSVEEDLESVQVLNQDKVLRRYLDLFAATLRTNFYQRNADGDYPAYLSLKISPLKLADIPEPKPHFEFFVYASRVEGVHLRTSKVARGGLRWSDRIEDYRTEVLGLVKAQQVKNAVIVPSGAKGGFVAKRLHSGMDRAAFMEEGIACYKLFIRGLLDITDNLVEGDITKPENVVCLDGDDPYLVVAADKGTATFSDIANGISEEKGHWLGDAFASGGSQGYDHKGMGITAKGAWVSVQRHFRELGLNTQTDAFTAIGIGDMGGDVFGNGMLLSESMKLVAAFNHLHIFIDPDPEPAAAYAERKRLFESTASGWSEYNKALISRGGGVYSRTDKYISLSPEVQALLGCTDTRLTPTALISRLLCSEVDLIWNGGIGTYVKSSGESHSEVGDKANDALRVNGEQLRCRVFGEGGNLGMTQKGRIEYCLRGGACNTDFIDNAAGVDCSDHEVNIKILIDEQVAQGNLTSKQRNALLASMTDDVSRLVLDNNYRQTQSLSIAEFSVHTRINEYRRFMDYLEELGRLDRGLEFLPTDAQVADRVGRGQALARPELCVLISYAKVQLKELLAGSNIAADPYCAEAVMDVFPEALHERYADAIKSHKLKREIIATQLANDFVNNLGITAYHRLVETTGSHADEVVKAYVTSRDVFRFEDFHRYIASHDDRMPAKTQYELLATMIRRVRRGTRWFLKNRRGGLDVAGEVENFRPRLAEVQKQTGELLPDQQREEWQQRAAALEAQGIDGEWLDLMAMPENLFSGVGIVEISNQSGASIAECTQMFLSLMHELNLNWFATQLSAIKVDNYWQANARESYIDDLESQARKLSILLLNHHPDAAIPQTISAWLSENEPMVARWMAMVKRVESSSGTDYAMFAVALRELYDLVQVTAFQ